jgi:hypothetical protein
MAKKEPNCSRTTTPKVGDITDTTLSKVLSSYLIAARLGTFCFSSPSVIGFSQDPTSRLLKYIKPPVASSATM